MGDIFGDTGAGICTKCKRTVDARVPGGECYYCANHPNETQDYAMRQSGGHELEKLRSEVESLRRERDEALETVKQVSFHADGSAFKAMLAVDAAVKARLDRAVDEAVKAERQKIGDQVSEALAHPVGDDTLITDPVAMKVLAYVKGAIDNDLSLINELDAARAERDRCWEETMREAKRIVSKLSYNASAYEVAEVIENKLLARGEDLGLDKPEPAKPKKRTNARGETKEGE